MRLTALCRKWFLPSHLRGEDVDSRRAVRTVMLGLAMLFWAPIFSIIYARVNAYFSALTLCTAGALMLVLLRSLHWGVSVKAAANGVICLVCVTLVALAAVTGGIEAPAFRWLAVIPLLGIQLGGGRSGLLWTLISLGCVVAFFSAQSEYGPLPSELTPATLKLVRMCGDLGMVICVAVVTAIFDRGESAAQAMLLDARYAAEAATRAKSTFLANMSHEIRTPMNGIVGMTNLTLRTSLAGPQREYLQIIRSSAESLLRIVDDILDFSKIEAGRLSLDETDFELSECIYDALRIVEPQAYAKGLAISCSISDSIPVNVCGDPFRVRQVLLNLLGNAVKFTREGKIQLTATTVARRFHVDEVHFSVRDTGVGIPEEKLDSVFRPFEQADASTTRTFGGTGLGLAISTQLVELMGGRLWVESTVGEGSCFHFTAKFRPAKSPHPVCRESTDFSMKAFTPTVAPPPSRRLPDVEPMPPEAEKLIQQVQPGEPERRRLRILVVDDNRINQRVAEIVLMQAGHDVVTASDGAEAVAMTVEHEVDLVLMDLSMPNLDGFGATAAIRARETDTGRTLPIIALTAHSLEEERNRCLSVGMNGFLVKPLQPAAIAAVIAEFCGDGMHV
jgi:signal transduction histidine kinase/CheY-like chemotaxis protein